MIHSQLLDWEVVESHVVAPVQVLFKEDGVKISQIAPNAISGSYTFDMHQSCRTALPASPHPRGAAVEAGRPRPTSEPITSTSERVDTAPCSAKKLHRKSRSASATPSTRAVSNPFNFGVLKRTTPPAFTPSKENPAVVGAPEPKVQRPRSFGTTFSFLQSRHGRGRLGSRSSTSSTKSEAFNSGSEDGEAVEPGPGSEPVSAVQKETQAQSQTSTTHYSAGSYLPIVRPEPPLAPNKPTLAQPGYHKAQTRKVLNQARGELMKEVRKAGYNVLVVEGWELTVLRQSERYRIKVVYRARPAVALSDSDSVEGMRVPHGPPYISVLDE